MRIATGANGPMSAMPRLSRNPSSAADNPPTRPKVVELGSDAALAAWDAAAALEQEPTGPPAWVHGDLMPGNLLLRVGRLSAIIDWGASGVGDPALDLLAGWTCLGPEGRSAYLTALDATSEQIALARALAVRKVAWGLPYYAASNPGFARAMQHTLDQVELVMELEEEFDINIPDDAAEKIQTVGQAVKYIESAQAS